MFGGLSWPSRTNAGAASAERSSNDADDDGGIPISSAPQTPPRSSPAGGNGQSHSNYSHGNGNGPSHSRESSLDEASMSDLTSTSYQQPQSSDVPSTDNSPALSELTEASGSASLAHRSTMMPALPSIHVGTGMNLHAIRRPARITSRLESIPSVGYVNSHEEPDDDSEEDSEDGGNADCSNCSGGGTSTSSPQHLRQDVMGHADKFSHHLQRYNDHVDKKAMYHHHHHNNNLVQTDVTDASTVDESYSESEWSTPHSSQSNLVASASRSSSSCDHSSSTTTTSTLQGLPHAQPPPHPLHTITSFNTSATDGDIDTDVDMDIDQDEDSLIYHHHQRSYSQQSQQQLQQQDRPLSPVLPAGSMTNRPPARRGERASSNGSGGSRALSPPTPRSVTTTASTTPRARSYHSPQHSQHHSHQPQQQQPRHPHRPPSRAGSISRPRYAVEFRHRPIKNGTVAEQQQHHHNHLQPHQHPSPVATEAAARAQAEYGRDGRHVERVVMDVDDPYLSHGSSADDWDGHMEEGGSHFQFHHRQNASRHPPHHKLRRSDAGLEPLPATAATVVGMAMHGTGSSSVGHHGHGGSKLMSNLFGTLFRTIRTTLLFGAVGAAVTLLRAHFLLAAGGAAASLVGGGGAAAALASSQGLMAGGGIAAVRLASGALALPRVTDLLLTAAVREAARAERAVLKEKVQRIARMLPDGRPVSVPGSGLAAATARGGGRRLSTRDGAASANGETYAVRLSTTPGRSDLTDAAVERLAQCPSIADVRLDHTSDSRDDGDLPGGWGDAGSIIKRPGLTTDAVLLLSDDLAFTCEELDRAFDIWSKDSDRMVGFYTYDLVPTETSSASFGLGEISRGKGGYSVISDRAAFVHRSYLTSISAKAAMDAASEWSAKRTEDSNVQCDSYALSLAISAVSSKAPISVAAEPLELRSASSSSSKKNSVSSSSAECLLGITSALGMQVLPSEERVYVG